MTGWAGSSATSGGGADLPVFYPATGAQIATLTEDNAQAVDQAVTSARRAFDIGPWSHLPTDARIEMLEACRSVILENADELARLECAATGLVFRELKARHMVRAAYNFRFFGQYIAHAAGQRFDQSAGYMTTVTREPVGVAALIAPWNAPVALATMKIAAALAFGNTCVLKPSEQTPLALAKLVALFRMSCPKGCSIWSTGVDLSPERHWSIIPVWISSALPAGPRPGARSCRPPGYGLCRARWSWAANPPTSSLPVQIQSAHWTAR